MVLVSNITLVVRNTPRLSVLHLIHIQHSHRRAAHTVHLSNQKTKPAGSTGNDDNFLTQVYLARDAMSNTLVDDAGHPAERDKGGPYDGGDHGRGIPLDRLSTEAERDDPADERMKKCRVKDLEDKVNRHGRKP